MNKTSRGCIIFILGSGLMACSSAPPPSLVASSSAIVAKAAPRLLFQSGFEGSTTLVGERFSGIDTTLPDKNDWDADIARISDARGVYVNYTGGNSSQRLADIISDPTQPSATDKIGRPNKVLRYWLADSWIASEHQNKARVQIDFYRIREGLKEFTQTVRVFIHPDFRELERYPERISWLAIAEFWNNEWWVPNDPYGFRIGLCMGKLSGDPAPLHFFLNAEDPGAKQVWHAENPAAIVPIGSWFTLEYYFKEGNKDTGRFRLAITPDGGVRQVLYDVHDFTHSTKDPAPDGLTGYNPMKLYTSKEVMAFMKAKGKPLQIYWDDFKLWQGQTVP